MLINQNAIKIYNFIIILLFILFLIFNFYI